MTEFSQEELEAAVRQAVDAIKDGKEPEEALTAETATTKDPTESS